MISYHKLTALKFFYIDPELQFWVQFGKLRLNIYKCINYWFSSILSLLINRHVNLHNQLIYLLC